MRAEIVKINSDHPEPSLIRYAADQIRAGEILGLAGLVGSGRSEVAHAVSGAARRARGTIRADGGLMVGTSIRAAMAAGVVMIAESRKEQGLLLRRSVRENVVLATLSKVSTAGFIRGGAERVTVKDFLDQVGVRSSAATLLAESLSGGNQQKVLFARALLSSPKVLVADEPTRGVDIGSKRAIYDLLVAHAAAGAGVLLISSDLEEVMGLAHRVLVMRSGHLVADLMGDRLTEESVISSSFMEIPARKHSEID